MNLQHVQALKDLYPQLRLRSGQLITTNEMSSKPSKEPGVLAVTVKTVFPPSARRRTELLVAEVQGGFHVRPVEPTGMADAQRFAELLRGRLELEGPAAPLRLVKDPSKVRFFVVVPAASDSPVTADDASAAPAEQNGAS